MIRIVAALAALSLFACGGEALINEDGTETLGGGLSQPSGAPIALPGKLEAEAYALGGEGVGFHDTSTGNSGKAYRQDAVDLEPTSDTGGGYNVGWVTAGEWLAYSVKTDAQGTFAFSARVSSNTVAVKTLHLEVDGKVLPAASFATADGWQAWSNVALGELELAPGTHTVKVVFDTAKLNLNFVQATFKAPTCTVSDKLVPSCGAWWGIAPGTRSGETVDAALRRIEASAGRKMDIVHTYHAGNESFPNTQEKLWSSEGRFLLLNWKPSKTSWSQAANGSIDASVIIPVADRIKAFNKKLFLNLFHEPEDNVGSTGTSAEYVAMWKHVREVFDARGVTNVVWVWNVMGYYGHSARYLSGELYPGDAYVDWIAYDPYNKGTTFRDFAYTTNNTTSQYPNFAGFYSWATAKFPNKPLMLGEYGSLESATNPAAKGDWMRGIVPALKSSRASIKAAVYWEFNGVDGVGDYRVDSSLQSSLGFREAGLDPFVNQKHLPY